MYLSDFDYLVEKLIETHPDPYSGFGGQITFYQEKTKLEQSISDSITTDDFIILMNQFLSNLDDGHTCLFFHKNNDADQKVLPLQFKISADKIFISNTSKEFETLIGNAIVEINDKPIEEWLLRTRLFQPSENISGEYYNLIKIISNCQLAQTFFGKIENLKFTLSNDTNNLIQKEIPFQTQVEFPEKKSKIESDNDNGLLYYAMIGKKHDIGYLAWNSVLSREVVENTFQNSPDWIQGNLNWAYKYLNDEQTGNIEKDIHKIPSLYEQFFLLSKSIKKAKSKYLIIDLRHNSGGMTPIIDPLLYILYGDTYLNFDFHAKMIRKISPLYLQKIGFDSIDDYNKAFNCNNKIGDYLFDNFGNVDSNLSLKQKREMLQSGYYGFGAEYVQKTEPLTDVQIFVLCSPQTFSAAYHFTYFLKRLGRTKIVGVASRQAGNAFMETTNFKLPKSGITGSISNSKQILFEENSPSGKMLKPDYEMNWDDFRNYGFDKNAEILKTLGIIEKD